MAARAVLPSVRASRLAIVWGEAMSSTYLAPEANVATTALIELVGVEKVYRSGRLEYPALRRVDLAIPEGEMVAIVNAAGGPGEVLFVAASTPG